MSKAIPDTATATRLLTILPLTPERLSELAVLFGQGGDPKWCWCASFRLRGADFSKARRHGAHRLEAYPVETEGNRLPSAKMHMGTLSMFERAGFEVMERRRANPTTVTRPIVRLNL